MCLKQNVGEEYQPIWRRRVQIKILTSSVPERVQRIGIPTARNFVLRNTLEYGQWRAGFGGERTLFSRGYNMHVNSIQQQHNKNH